MGVDCRTARAYKMNTGNTVAQNGGAARRSVAGFLIFKESPSAHPLTRWPRSPSNGESGCRVSDFSTVL